MRSPGWPSPWTWTAVWVTSLVAGLPDHTMGSVAVMEAGSRLMRAVLRLTGLPDGSGDSVVMAPAGSAAARCPARRVVTARPHRIGAAAGSVDAAANWLREHCRAGMAMEESGRMAGMGMSGIFRHGKRITDPPPLNVRKMPRLYEARRLLMVGGHDVAGVDCAVGRESPTRCRGGTCAAGWPPARSRRRPAADRRAGTCPAGLTA